MKIIIEVKMIESENVSVFFFSIFVLKFQLAFLAIFNEHFSYLCVPLFLAIGGNHNPYNGVVCNDTILATGVFSSKELWKLAKGAPLCKDTQKTAAIYFPMAEIFSLIFPTQFLFIAFHRRLASILDESGDSTVLLGPSESTIKLENSGGGGSSVSGAAAIAAYYCNNYPLTTSSPGLVTAVSSADRNSSMLVSGSYSKSSD